MMKRLYIILIVSLLQIGIIKANSPINFVEDEEHLIISTLNSDPELRSSLAPDNGTSPSKSFVVKEVPKCLGPNDVMGLCDVDDEYDEEIQLRFLQALKRSNLVGDFGDIFSGLLHDDVQNDIPVTVSDDPGVRTRIGPGGLISEDPVCPAREKIIYPKRGQTKSNEYVFLLNQPEGEYRQGIRVEECIGENLECSIGKLSGIDSVCRQKYIFKKMLSLDRTGTRLAPESVLVPSCCVCYMKTTFPRFGRNGSIPFIPTPSKTTAPPSEVSNVTVPLLPDPTVTLLFPSLNKTEIDSGINDVSNGEETETRNEFRSNLPKSMIRLFRN